MSNTRVFPGNKIKDTSSWETPAVKEDKDTFVVPKQYRARIIQTNNAEGSETWHAPPVKEDREAGVLQRPITAKVYQGEEIGSRFSLWDEPLIEEIKTVVSEIIEEVEELEGEQEPVPLTAEAIAEIQKNAYDEAFEEGKKAGYEKGFEEGKTAGYEDGKTAGTEEGIKLGKAELEPYVQDLVAIFEKLERPVDDLDEEVEEELVSLAIAIAKQIVRRELKLDPTQIIAVIREVITVLPLSSRDIRVYLHPDDAAIIAELMQTDREISVIDEKRWRVVEDASLTRGGCQVETDKSRLDATVETRLAAAIAQALGGERSNDTSRN
ncbi:MAG: flagellar assembly protein FliH [Gammaproteobacteria bacterium]|nr:flagellar assembly protein FliH [Gammaproteobacteria bacterium]MDH5691568.1 flagellar assembly protein FliH [Gammaproteobacteria bacterium]